MLVLRGSAPARADVPAQDEPVQTNGKALPLPAPGTHRLIRIGPQALVMEDDRGQFTMVDEADAETPEKAEKGKRGQSALGASVMMAILSAGALWFFQTQSDLTERVAH
jgi:hypothetical protein